ncbi:MAG: wax ester/triacylglycerol synthase domain-containing protein, partial [Spongiibacter sp.]
MTDHPTFKDDVDALELLMLRGEGSVKTRSAMLSVLLLETAPDFAELRATFDQASRQFIRLRQHVVMPAIGITPPKWVVDPDFDLNYHLRRLSAPAPARLRDVLDSASQILAAPMDLDRPLWEVYLIEGLQEPGANAALLMKMHHAVSDGMGGLLLLKLLFSTTPDGKPQADIPPPIPQDLDPLTLTRRGL